MTRPADFTRTTKLAAFERACGACEVCRRRLFPGDRIEYDHRIPCEQGGKGDIANCQVLCGWCHAEKTAGDAKVIAKSRAVRAAHARAKTVRNPLGSKGSKWKRKINGTVVPR